MIRLYVKFFVIFYLLFFSAISVFAEDITITTYYPSPYGSYKNLNIYNIDESATQTDFTQGVTKAGLLISTEYADGAFTPGVFWSTSDNNATKPKAGIYLKETGSGTNMYFGTSNAYATGITNNALVIDPSGNLAASGSVTSSGSSGIGYSTGAGGTVTQSTSKSTGVTINKPCGTITMNGAALAADTIATFTVTDSVVAATDVIVTQHDSVGTIGGYTVTANTSAAGSFKISVRNNTVGSLSEAIVIRFAVIKAVIS